ncbi:hypothetical protein [Clostridium tagluense]|uniref:hypothetical protein n=1 Tax=Clostridium tagluense TaxID=360422 RepID=UPI001C0C671F|nr:hypothetical protein [Clostridium tagluense]MBU3126654.1 hypothetical protein [Clostridium tagluense]
MKKLLRKVLSVLVFISIVLPSTNIVFVAGGVSAIDIVNNAGIPDTVKVTGLDVGDTVTVCSITQPELLPGFNPALASGLQLGLPVNTLATRNTPFGYRCSASESGTASPIFAIPTTITPYNAGIQAAMLYGTVTISIPQLSERGFICITVTSKTFLQIALSQAIEFKKE